jgi:hypothetical protein
VFWYESYEIKYRNKVAMTSLATVMRRLPYEIINIILSYSEDGLVHSTYHLGSGKLIHRIQWKSEYLYELESTVLIRRIFPMYWYYGADLDEKYIYFFMKEYFKQKIQLQGRWNNSDQL